MMGCTVPLCKLEKAVPSRWTNEKAAPPSMCSLWEHSSASWWSLFWVRTEESLFLGRYSLVTGPRDLANRPAFSFPSSWLRALVETTVCPTKHWALTVWLTQRMSRCQRDEGGGMMGETIRSSRQRKLLLGVPKVGESLGYCRNWD